MSVRRVTEVWTGDVVPRRGPTSLVRTYTTPSREQSEGLNWGVSETGDLGINNR